jgi:predicted MFS family arabinose efflux permease
METAYDPGLVRDRAAWGAVLSMALCVSVLIASEFMPVSLLSPIATDLGITKGRTGQAISISGAFAVITSLLVAGLTRRIDRKLVVIGFTMLLIVSGLAVTFALITHSSWSVVRCSASLSAASGQCRRRSSCASCPATSSRRGSPC